MADFEISSPDGRKFVVTAPEGATQEQVLAYAQQHFSTSSPAQADVRKAENAMTPYTPPPTRTQAMISAGIQGLRAGPAGLPAMLTGEGMRQFDTGVERGAYHAGGLATDITGSPEVGLATNATIQAIPAVLSGSVVGKTAAPALEKLAMNRMQKAVQPTTADLLSGDAEKAFKTLLNEGVNVTPGGMAELRKRISDLYAKVAQEIKSSKGTVDVDEVANAVKRAYSKFVENPVGRETNLADIQAAKASFLKTVDDAMGFYSDKMPVQLAQRIKQRIQQALSDEFGKLSTAGTEAFKDIAYKLRTGINKLHPNVAADNAKIHELMNALSVSERHALHALNKSSVGIGFLAENPIAAASFMAERSEAFKSIVARMINAAKERLPQAAAGTTAAVAEGAKQNMMER